MSDQPTQDKVRRLPNLPVVSRKTLLTKSLRSPIIPIILAALVSGLGQEIMLTNVGIILCALWLCWDLWPWAGWISLKAANRRYSIFEGPKRTAEVFRRKQQRKLQRTVFALFDLLVIALAIGTIRFVDVRKYLKIKETVFQEMHASLSLAQDGTFNNSKFTVVNDSPFDIRLRRIGCYLSYSRTMG